MVLCADCCASQERIISICSYVFYIFKFSEYARHTLNRALMILFAKMARYPVFCWCHVLTGYQTERLRQAEENLLYSFALSEFFILQILCFTIDNIADHIGHFNGVHAIMHSLCFDPREDMQVLQQKIESASPGKMIMMQYAPLSVNVQLVNPNPSIYTAQDILCPGKLVVPVMEHSCSCVEPTKSLELARLCGAKAPIKEI
jgi:hypothetical protein